MAKLILAFFLITAFAGACFGEFSAFLFPKDETVVFENYSGTGNPAMVTNTYYRSGSNYIIKITEANGNVAKITVNKNFAPLSYKKVNKNGAILEFAAYSKDKLNISIPARNIKKTVKLPSTYYDPYTLYYIFRKFPYAKKDNIYMNIAYHDPGNIRVVKMYVKNKGVETVKIKAGKFTCYKLEMGTVNPLDVAVWPYKYYFWFTTDSNHHFVKFQGRDRDSSILNSELATYKIGSKYVVKRSSLNNTGFQSDIIEQTRSGL